jgi:hypothetical protein
VLCLRKLEAIGAIQSRASLRHREFGRNLRCGSHNAKTSRGQSAVASKLVWGTLTEPGAVVSDSQSSYDFCFNLVNTLSSLSARRSHGNPPAPPEGMGYIFDIPGMLY